MILPEYADDLSNLMARAGVAYMTSWNEAALVDMEMKKSELGIPVSKKTSQPFAEISEGLEPFAKGFQVPNEYLQKLADAVTEPVQEACTNATARVAKKKSRAEDHSATTSEAIPDYFPPPPSHPWVAHTARNLLRRCPKWVLDVRTNETNTIRYAVVFEILSILSHRQELVTRTAAGAYLRQSVYETLAPFFPGFKFPDGLPDPKPLEPSEQQRLRDGAAVLKWQRHLSYFAGRVAQMPLDFGGMADEDDKEMVKEELQKMLMVNVIHPFLCNALIRVGQAVARTFKDRHQMTSLVEVKLPKALLLKGQEDVNLLNHHPQKHLVKVSTLSSVIIN
jgi:hypothetical protein